MPPQVIALGELLVEIMRPGVDQPLSQPGEFVGPFPSGAPAIFIDAAARLGASTAFIGVVGGTSAGIASSRTLRNDRVEEEASTEARPDDFGRCVLNRLRDDGVDISCVRTAPGYTTGIAFVSYRSDGSRNFVFHLPQSAAALLDPDDVKPECVSHAAFVHITGSALSISETARQACYRAAQMCKAGGGRVSFDPNIRPELSGVEQVREICAPILELCDVLLPSESEASMLTGEADEKMACRSLTGRGIPIVALKRGAQGSTVFTASQEIDAPPLFVQEVDPTGAGDCYGGAFVVGLLHAAKDPENWDLGQIARFANVAGALAVTRKGPMEGAARLQDVLDRM